MSLQEWTREDGYRISTDPACLDLDLIHRFLSEESYWAQGVPREVMERAITNSLPFGLYHTQSGAQVGFARFITDQATFAYLADVFIVPPHRGQGLSKWLVQTILTHPELQGLRRFLLFTRDAHSLYNRYGFTPVPNPEDCLVKYEPNPYNRG